VLNELALRMSTLMHESNSKEAFVPMVEIPDSAASERNARKVSLETRAYEVALETTHADGFNKTENHMSLMSCTRGKVKILRRLVNLVC
jgi:hypothetical protein